MKETEEVWRGLGGPLYDELVQNREAAFRHLFNADWKVRVAAIHVCQSTWQGSVDSGFLDACRQLAANDPKDVVRQLAIHSFGLEERIFDIEGGRLGDFRGADKLHRQCQTQERLV